MPPFYLRLKNGRYHGTYPQIYGFPWSFYIRVRYMRAYFWSPFLSPITRSTCTEQLIILSREHFCSVFPNLFWLGALLFSNKDFVTHQASLIGMNFNNWQVTPTALSFGINAPIGYFIIGSTILKHYSHHTSTFHIFFRTKVWLYEMALPACRPTFKCLNIFQVRNQFFFKY